MLNDFFHHYLGAWNRLEGLQKLNWLPIIKRRDLALLKITQKALYDDVWPDYLRLKFHTVSAYNLRSLEAPKLAVPIQLKAALFRTKQRDYLISYLIGKGKSLTTTSS